MPFLRDSEAEHIFTLRNYFIRFSVDILSSMTIIYDLIPK